MVTRSPVNTVQKSYESVPSVKHLSRTDTELTSPRKEVTVNCYDCFFWVCFSLYACTHQFICLHNLFDFPCRETVGSSMFNLSVLIPSIVNKLFRFSRFNLILKIFIIIHHTWLIAHDIISLHDNEDVYKAMYIFWNSSMEHFLHYFSRNLSVHTSAYKTKMNQFTAN